jgi:hypothetical protein
VQENAPSAGAGSRLSLINPLASGFFLKAELPNPRPMWHTDAMTFQPIANPFLHADSTIRSLNRARIMALDGVPGAFDLLGKTGYDLLSAASLHRQISAAAARLQLNPAASDLIRRFDACFDQSATRRLACAMARRYGFRLGCLLLMLKRGEPANRAARPEWSDAHWTFWQAVQRVVVGGGLLAGRLGREAVATAQAVLARARVSDLELQYSPFGAHLPLVGLACFTPPGMTRSLLFDFGQSAVKRGCAHYQAGQLTHIDLWPDAPTVCQEHLPTHQSDAEIQQRWERMLTLIRASWATVPADQRAYTAIGMSLACYLLDGHPSSTDDGCYGALQKLSPHLASFIGGELVQRLGAAVPVRLMHDGAAAASVYAGYERTVVITLGTAIGNGFPPQHGGQSSRAHDFTLRPTAEPKP